MTRIIFSVVIIALMVGCTAAEAPGGNQEPELDAGPEDILEANGDEEDGSSQDSGQGDVANDVGDIDDGDDAGGEEERLYQAGDRPEGSEHLWVGTWGDWGSGDYQALYQGDLLTWEQGMQGGFHIWGGFRAEGTPFASLSDQAVEAIFHDYSLYDQAGELVATTNRFGFVDKVEGGLESGPFTVILRRTMNPNEALDGPFELVLTLTLESGDEFESRVWIYLECCEFL